MTRTNIDWTHKNITITDVRKLNKLYVLKITDPMAASQIESPLFVKDNIFEERLKSYFLKDIVSITRNEILNVNWNMYITKGYYIKVNEKGNIEKYNNDSEKWYISYLEIEGPLGTFTSVYRDKELISKDSAKHNIGINTRL
jgi:hypothetical protein